MSKNTAMKRYKSKGIEFSIEIQKNMHLKNKGTSAGTLPSVFSVLKVCLSSSSFGDLSEKFNTSNSTPINQSPLACNAKGYKNLSF